MCVDFFQASPEFLMRTICLSRVCWVSDRLIHSLPRLWNSGHVGERCEEVLVWFREFTICNFCSCKIKKEVSQYQLTLNPSLLGKSRPSSVSPALQAERFVCVGPGTNISAISTGSELVIEEEWDGSREAVLNQSLPALLTTVCPTAPPPPHIISVSWPAHMTSTLTHTHSYTYICVCLKVAPLNNGWLIGLTTGFTEPVVHHSDSIYLLYLSCLIGFRMLCLFIEGVR